MITLTVEIEGKTESIEVTQDTYEILRDGCELRNRPMAWYLLLTVQKFGSLSEENILKLMDEYWIL